MGSYEYHGFFTVGRELTDAQMKRAKMVSSHGEVTRTSLEIVYNWSSFGRDPHALLGDLFDLYIHVTSYGNNALAFTLPRDSVDVETLRPYAKGTEPVVKIGRKHVLCVLKAEEEGGDWVDEEAGSDWMRKLSAVRGLVASGDLRPLYLGWLRNVFNGLSVDVPGKEVEPPVPPGLKGLKGPVRALADFLMLGNDVLKEAAKGSQGDAPSATPASRKQLLAAIRKLPAARKDALLLDAALEESSAVGARLRGLAAGKPKTARAAAGKRTARDFRRIAYGDDDDEEE